MSTDSNPTTNKRNWLKLAGILLAVLLLFGAIYFAGTTDVEPTAAGKDAAAILALITAVAVAIERVIASGWALVDQSKYAWWPFTEMGKQVDDLLKTLDEQLQPIYDDAAAVFDTAKKLGAAAEKGVDAAKDELAKTKTRIETMKAYAPNSQRLNLIAASANLAIGYVEQIDINRRLKMNIQLANQAIAGLTDFVGSFRDNPGRRLISIYVGALLGLGVAGALGLDLFYAIFGQQVGQQSVLPHLGVVFTGLVIGLGSNPTHEVIRVLQEVKKQRAAQNQPGPSGGGGGETKEEAEPKVPSAREEAEIESTGAPPLEDVTEEAARRVYYPPIRRFR